MTTFARKKARPTGGPKRGAGGMGILSSNRLKKQVNVTSEKPALGAGKYKVHSRDTDANRIKSDATSISDKYLDPSGSAATKASDSSKNSSKDKEPEKPSKAVPSIYQRKKYSPRVKNRGKLDDKSDAPTTSGIEKKLYQPKRNYNKPWQRPSTAGNKPTHNLKSGNDESKVKEDQRKKASDIVSRRKQFKPSIAKPVQSSADKSDSKISNPAGESFDIEIDTLEPELKNPKQRDSKQYPNSSKNVLTPSGKGIKKAASVFEQDKPKREKRVMKKLNSAHVYGDNQTPRGSKQFSSGSKPTGESKGSFEANDDSEASTNAQTKQAANGVKRASKMIGDVKKKRKHKHAGKPSFSDEKGSTITLGSRGQATGSSKVDTENLNTEDDFNEDEEEKVAELEIADQSVDSTNNSKIVDQDDDDEEQIDEIELAFNFGDDNFDIDDQDSKTPLAGAGLDEIREDEEVDENIDERKQFELRISEIESEIKQLWNELTKLSDEEKAKVCFDFFKENITDSDDINDYEKMETVHKFIKKQEIKDYKKFCFE